MRKAIQTIGAAAAVATTALIVVGVVSGEIARHVLQTLPLWPAIILGLTDSPKARWASLPFLFWLVIMLLIWAYLLHFSNIAAGTYSPIEIAMTVVVVLAAVAGTGAAAAAKTDNKTEKFPVLGWFGGGLLLLGQVALMQVSLRPPFENDAMFLHWIIG